MMQYNSYVKIISCSLMILIPAMVFSNHQEDDFLIQSLGEGTVHEQAVENLDESEWLELKPHLDSAFPVENFADVFIDEMLKPLLITIPQEERQNLLELLATKKDFYVPYYGESACIGGNIVNVKNAKDERYKQSIIVISSLLKVNAQNRAPFWNKCVSLVRENQVITADVDQQGIRMQLASVILPPPELIESLQKIYTLVDMPVFSLYCSELFAHLNTQLNLRTILDNLRKKDQEQIIKFFDCVHSLNLLNDSQKELIMMNLVQYTNNHDIVLKTTRALLFMRGNNHKVWSFVIKTPIEERVDFGALCNDMQGVNPYKNSDQSVITDHQKISKILSPFFEQIQGFPLPMEVSDFYHQLFLLRDNLMLKEGINIDLSEIVYFVKMMTLPIYETGILVSPPIYDPDNSVVEVLKRGNKLIRNDFQFFDYISQFKYRDRTWKMEELV